MKVLARQLAVDMYSCNPAKLADLDAIKDAIRAAFNVSLTAQSIDANHAAIVGAFHEGHVAVHLYPALRYVAVDIFTCTDSSDPDALEKVLRKFFQPEKLKSTFLKRGDFGQERDILPRIKTRVAQLRRVRNVGANVVKKLIRRDK